MMRLFRVFQVLRLFKLGRYFEALQIITKVIRASWPQLVMSVAICLFVMLFSAIIMYTVENPFQPEQFPNVISSLWWALCTLTTVGYGDVYPVTSIGKIFASVISLVGIGIIAIPTGIIAAGFSSAISKKQEDDEPKAGLLLDEMGEDELLSLQIKLSKRLREYGHSSTISIKGKKQA